MAGRKPKYTIDQPGRPCAKCGTWKPWDEFKPSTKGAAKRSAWCIQCHKIPPEKAAWYSMKQRCFNIHDPSYSNYGGRGITVCQGFLDFSVFFKELGPKPESSNRLTLDRIENEGHYSCGQCDQCLQNGWPMNLRWATYSQQNQNRRPFHIPFHTKIKKASPSSISVKPVLHH